MFEAIASLMMVAIVVVLAFFGVKNTSTPPEPKPPPPPEPDTEPLPEPIPEPEPTPEPTTDPEPISPVLTVAEQVEFLKAVGLPSDSPELRKRSWKQWQEASTWSTPPLAVDGDCGPLTTADARVAIENGFRIAPHFHLSEFTCRCGGTYTGCRKMRAQRRLVLLLEKVRADGYQSGLSIVSGYRCPTHNAAVGGYPASCHLSGAAADIPGKYAPGWFRNRGFMGIEFRKSHGNVTHVDICNPHGPDHVFGV